MSLVLSTSGKLRTQAQCLWRKRLQKLTDSSWAGDKHTPHLLPGAISSVPSPDSLPQRHNFSCQATLIHHRPWCLVTLRAPFFHFCVLLPTSNTFQGIRVFFWWPEGLNSTSCISENSENKEQRPITIACPGNMEMSWLIWKGSPTLPSLGGQERIWPGTHSLSGPLLSSQLPNHTEEVQQVVGELNPAQSLVICEGLRPGPMKQLTSYPSHLSPKV